MTAQIIKFPQTTRAKAPRIGRIKPEDSLLPKATEEVVLSASTYWICFDYLKYRSEDDPKYREAFDTWVTYCQCNEDTEFEIPESYVDAIVEDGNGITAMLALIYDWFSKAHE